MMIRYLLVWVFHFIATCQYNVAFLSSSVVRRQCNFVLLVHDSQPHHGGDALKGRRRRPSKTSLSPFSTKLKEKGENKKRRRVGTKQQHSIGDNHRNNGEFQGRGKQSTRHTDANNTSKKLNTDEKTTVILYYKPKNVITSHSNSDATSKSRNDSKKEKILNTNDDNKSGRKTVYEDIMSMKGFIDWGENDIDSTSSPSAVINVGTTKTFQEITGIYSKLHAVGRLDCDTTGLLLLTNDGGLIHHVTNPTASTKPPLMNNEGNGGSKSNRVRCSNDGTKNDFVEEVQVLKTYEAVIMGYHTLPQYHEEHKDKQNNNCGNSMPLLELYKGVDIGAKYGGMTKPVHELIVLGHPTDKSTLVRITIGEGKNRQVRRMFHAIGSGVMRLHRCKVGNIDLETMLGSKEGSWRLLSEDEIERGLGWKVRKLDEYSTGSTRRNSSSNIGKRRTRRSNGRSRNNKTNHTFQR